MLTAGQLPGWKLKDVSVSAGRKETEPKHLGQDSPWLKGNGAPAHVYLSMETVLGLLGAPSRRQRLVHQNGRKREGKPEGSGRLLACKNQVFGC